MSSRTLTLCIIVGTQLALQVRAQQGDGRLRVETATVATTRGVPRLLINGKPQVPLLFFFNTDITKEKTDEYMATQLGMSAEAGVHIYSLPLRCPRLADGVTPNFDYADSLLDRFIVVDPLALFLLRVYPGPNYSWADWRELGPEEFEWYGDGSQCEDHLSLGSDLVWGPTDDDLAELVRRFETSPYADRIIGYQPGCPGHENFPPFYRERGPDVSPSNTRRFREWLRDRYDTDDELRAAWGSADVSLDIAEVPVGEEGRFPMHGVGADEVIDVFYSRPHEQDWIDFSAFTSDITSDRLLRMARVVRHETQGRKLVCFFYGYTYELCGSFGGHYRLRRLLDSRDVDVLASPYSYFDRFPGGAGSFMGAVDSVSAHGKLWFNEDDTRTSVADLSQVGEWAVFEETVKDLDQTLGVLDRNLAAVMMHRTGTWWMDLTASGAFADHELWRLMAQRRRTYEGIYAAPSAYRPDVALIVDEESKHYVKSDWDANRWALVESRDQAAKCGATVGHYLLSDFVDGIAPRCPVYVFVNAFALSDADIGAVRRRLQRERATALWLYAPGLVGPKGLDTGRASRLVGMELSMSNGVLGSQGHGLLEGVRWGQPLNVSPRLVVTDAHAERLGVYESDGAVSSARARSGGVMNVFLGDMGIAAKVLRQLVRAAGVHVYCDQDVIIHSDGRFLAVHVGAEGGRIIIPREGARLVPLDGAGEPITAPQMVSFGPGQTRWYRVQ